MAEIFTCILCGRRGTQRFVLVTPDPDHPEDGRRARCQDRRACQRRIDTTHTATTAAEGEEVLSESVAGLARELDNLRRQVQDLRGMRGQVEDLTRVVGDLAEQVQGLSARPGKPVAPTWLALPGDQVGEVFTDLVEWLGAVWLRYADAVLPECWAFHPDVIEELLWLRHAWHAAYLGEAASVTAAADWHDRYRPAAVKRIKQAAGMCSLEKHRTPTAPATAPLARLLDPVLQWWSQHRDQAPPAPSERQFAAVDARHEGDRG